MGSIPLKTEKMLWARSGNRCAFKGCSCLLVDDITGSSLSVIGQVAHIVPRSSNGPPGAAWETIDDKETFENLILLCPSHHKVIDDDDNLFTVQVVTEMKRLHEEAYAREEDADSRQLRLDEELYAGYIDTWAEHLALDSWTEWTWYLLSHTEPKLERERLEALQALRPWLHSRVWPGRFPELEDSLINFQLVVDDLVETFVEAAIVWMQT